MKMINARYETQYKTNLKIIMTPGLFPLVKYSSINQPDGDDLANGQIDSIHLSDEDDGDSLVQGRSIHVDCRSDGQYEPCHSRVQTEVLFQTAECDRKRSGASRQRARAHTHTHTHTHTTHGGFQYA